jgi:tripartite-type tricarboxylate transporter receptor subunit TctC
MVAASRWPMLECVKSSKSKTHFEESAMTTTRRQLLTLAAAAIVTRPSSAFASDDYPNKTIKIIVAAAPGGPTDLPARLASEILKTKFGQPVVVENRPGAGGAIAARYTAAAAPDGQIIMMGTISEIAINPHVNPKIGYDIWKDFAMITSVAYTPMTVVVHPSVQAKSIQDLIALARAKPGSLK